MTAHSNSPGDMHAYMYTPQKTEFRAAEVPNSQICLTQPFSRVQAAIHAICPKFAAVRHDSRRIDKKGLAWVFYQQSRVHVPVVQKIDNWELPYIISKKYSDPPKKSGNERILPRTLRGKHRLAVDNTHPSPQDIANRMSHYHPVG